MATEAKLCKLLKTIALAEQEVERARIKLAKNLYFNARQAYNSVNFDRREFISAQDLAHFLQAERVPFDLESVNWVISLRLNKLVPGIDFKSFCRIILPRTNQMLHTEGINRNVQFNQSNLSKLNQSLAIFFTQEIKYFKQVQFAIRKANLRYCDQLYDAIYPKQQYNIISRQDMTRFMLYNNTNFDGRDWYALLWRADSDSDGIFEKQEFFQLVIPFRMKQDTMLQFNDLRYAYTPTLTRYTILAQAQARSKYEDFRYDVPLKNPFYMPARGSYLQKAIPARPSGVRDEFHLLNDVFFQSARPEMIRRTRGMNQVKPVWKLKQEMDKTFGYTSQQQESGLKQNRSRIFDRR